MKKDKKSLIIVESPSKIKTITKLLGEDFRVVSTVGHIKDLPEKEIGIEIDSKGKVLFKYVVMKGKAAVIKDICQQASAAQHVYVGSDNDREGEVIAWHIAQEIQKFYPAAQVSRITFNEITKPALIDSIKNKGQVDMDKVYAQQARRAVDRWVGYEISPILWRAISKGLSAGRVQSAVLLLICNREQEILAFVPVESWTIEAVFTIEKKKEVINALLHKFKGKAVSIADKKGAGEFVKALEASKSAIVSKIVDKERSKNPNAPFMTSSLQQEAFNKLGFSVDKTMTLAQKLYEGVAGADGSPEALITYMRTDSTRLSDTFVEGARTFIAKHFDKAYLPKNAVLYTAKESAQDAHEAIRPVNTSVTPERASTFLEKDLAKLYSLIWKRSVASQMAPAKYAQRQLVLTSGDFEFKANGSTLLFDGFLKLYASQEDDDEEASKTLPEVFEGQSVSLKSISPKQHFTEPPARYNQASLVKEMGVQGIGRPSTYANTISTIIKRNYVTIDKKRFFPTELGKAVIKLLAQNMSEIISISFTAKMETELDKIAEKEAKKDDVLHSFYTKFKADLAKFQEAMGGKKESIMTDIVCPECKDANLAIKFSKSVEFAGCSNYPTCKFTCNFTRDENGVIALVEKKAVQQLDDKCPQCSSNLVVKSGRFGEFVACPNYPKCKYIKSDALKVGCPDCGSSVTKRSWKKGIFWGCTGYPKCKFAVFGDVKEVPCKDCGRQFMQVVVNKNTGEESLVCSNKACLPKSAAKPVKKGFKS